MQYTSQSAMWLRGSRLQDRLKAGFKSGCPNTKHPPVEKWFVGQGLVVVKRVLGRRRLPGILPPCRHICWFLAGLMGMGWFMGGSWEWFRCLCLCACVCACVRACVRACVCDAPILQIMLKLRGSTAKMYC